MGLGLVITGLIEEGTEIKPKDITWLYRTIKRSQLAFYIDIVETVCYLVN